MGVIVNGAEGMDGWNAWTEMGCIPIDGFYPPGTWVVFYLKHLEGDEIKVSESFLHLRFSLNWYHDEILG